jgi:hypothetical protein
MSRHSREQVVALMSHFDQLVVNELMNEMRSCFHALPDHVSNIPDGMLTISVRQDVCA